MDRELGNPVLIPFANKVIEQSKKDKGEYVFSKQEAKWLRSFEVADILSGIIGGGVLTNTSSLLSAEILRRFEGDLERLCNASRKELQSIKGIGFKRATQLLLLFSFIKKVMAFIPDKKIKINNPDDVKELLYQEMRFYRKEVVKVLLLDIKHQLMKIETISVGVLDGSIMHPREIFQPAIIESAHSIIIVHNHPSGNSQPSLDDIKITERLVEVGGLLGITMEDHVIFGGEGVCSLRETKLVDFSGRSEER